MIPFLVQIAIVICLLSMSILGGALAFEILRDTVFNIIYFFRRKNNIKSMYLLPEENSKEDIEKTNNS